MSLIAFSTILEGRSDSDKFAQAYVQTESIIAIQEDIDDKNCCYILLSSGHDMHVNMGVDEVKRLIS